MALEVNTSSRFAVQTFMLSSLLSILGNVVTVFALPWFVLETTGSAGRAGLTGMAFTLPIVLAGIFGGVLIDKLGGRRMAAISDVASGFFVALIPICYSLDILNLPLLLVLTFMATIFDVPGLTARRAVLPNLTEGRKFSLEAMNSTLESMINVATIFGAIFAGFYIEWFGAISLLWVNAGTFFVSAVLVYVSLNGVPTPDLTPDHDKVGVRAWAHEIAAGFRFLRNDSLLLTLALVLVVFSGLAAVIPIIVLPVYVEEIFGDANRLGVLLMSTAIGNLIGAIWYGSIGHRVRPWRRWILISGVAVYGLMQWLLVWDIAYWFLVVLVFLVGLVEGPVQPLLVTVRQERIPERLRGRVFGTFTALGQLATPLTMVITGFVLEHMGLRDGILLMASVYTVMIVGLLFVRPLAQMNRPAT